VAGISGSLAIFFRLSIFAERDCSMAGIAQGLQSLNHLSSPPSQHILNSWKEIAAYLGRGVRTVQRWEENLGLPVHRPGGRMHSAVLALPEELDQWLRHTQVRSHGNGNGDAPNGTHKVAIDLLGIARDLLVLSERLVDLDRGHQPEAEKLAHALHEIVSKLTDGNRKAAAFPPNPPVRAKRSAVISVIGG